MQEIEFNSGAIKPVECLKEGWELIKPQYWLIFAITLVGMLIAGFIPFALGLGAMYCGIYYAIFRLMKGETAEFGDLFKGFNYFVPSLIATLAFVIPVAIFTLLTWVSVFGVFAAMSNSGGQIEPAAIFTLYGIMIAEGVVFGVILGCIHAFVMFTYPLIVEHNLSGVEAFKLSSKAVWHNLGGVTGFIFAEFVLGFISYLACGVGLYFTLPIMFAGALVAYRKVFPDTSGIYNNPPAPNNYQEFETN